MYLYHSKLFLVNDRSFLPAWSPALRTGEIWNNWIEFDLLTVAKITAIKVGNSANIGGETFRPPEEIMIQVGDSSK